MREKRSYPYLDYIFHYKRDTFDECIDIVSEIFKRLSKHGMQVNLEKCELMDNTLELLGYQLTKTGSRPTAERIEAIPKLGKPKNKKIVRQIIGIVHFIKNYIPNCTEVTHPLTNLTKKDVDFKFSKKEEESFCNLKAKVAESILLTYLPRFFKAIYYAPRS